jgi:hypothetical protein
MAPIARRAAWQIRQRSGRSRQAFEVALTAVQ